MYLARRSDKAFMTNAEIEAKQRQQRELQAELDRQVQDKKRQKVGGSVEICTVPAVVYTVPGSC
jgi:hypothetical protein